MDMTSWKRLAAGIGIGAIAVAALAPSIMINVAHAVNGGGEIPMLVLAVMSVVAAPLCLMAMPKLRAEGRLDVLAGAAVLFVLSVTFNMTNAVGLAGGARDHAREDRQGQMAKVAWAEQRLTQVQADLAAARTIAGGATPEMAAAELLGLRGDPIYPRSKECANVTLPDSKAHCGKIAEALARKGAAEQVKDLTGERNNLTGQLGQWGAAPETADPKIDRIASLLSLIVPGERWVGIAMDLNAALLVELMGAFLPAIAAMLLWISRDEEIKPVVAAAVAARALEPVEPLGSAPVLASQPELIGKFVSTCFRPGQGEATGSEVFEAFAAWWREFAPDLRIPSQRELAKALADAGITKAKRGGRIRYAAALVHPAAVH